MCTVYHRLLISTKNLINFVILLTLFVTFNFSSLILKGKIFDRLLLCIERTRVIPHYYLFVKSHPDCVDFLLPHFNLFVKSGCLAVDQLVSLFHFVTVDFQD